MTKFIFLSFVFFASAACFGYAKEEVTPIKTPEKMPNIFTADEISGIKDVIDTANGISKHVDQKQFDLIMDLFNGSGNLGFLDIELHLDSRSLDAQKRIALRWVTISFIDSIVNDKIFFDEVRHRNVQPDEIEEFRLKYHMPFSNLKSSIRVIFKDPVNHNFSPIRISAERAFGFEQLLLSVNSNNGSVDLVSICRYNRFDDKVQCVGARWKENGDIDDSIVSEEYTREEYERRLSAVFGQALFEGKNANNQDKDSNKTD